jgi:hypothetical protein
LPFWSNARRHLLETAAAAPPRQQGHVMAFGLRSALSAAVVVFAIGIAGAAFFVSSNPANETRFAISAELAEIERKVGSLDDYRTQGAIIPPGLLDELQHLALRTSTLYEHVANQDGALEQLASLIDRQQEFIAYAQSSGYDHPDLVNASEHLSEAEEKMGGGSTALIESPEPIETADTTAMIPTIPVETTTPEPEPTREPTPTGGPAPTQTAEPSDPFDPADLEEGQVLVLAESSDTTLGLDWNRVWTVNGSFVYNAAWSANLSVDEGRAELHSNYVVINLPASEEGPSLGPIVLTLTTGEVVALINGEQITLRSEEGTVIDPAEIVELTGELGPALYHFLTSIDITAEITAEIAE